MTSSTTDSFVRRHIGPQPDELGEMLTTIGVSLLDALLDQTVPKKSRLKKPLKTGRGEREHEYLTRLKSIAARNKIVKSFVGLGDFDPITPSVILGCVLGNPSWYTSYTPYQAEIAQDRFEALLNVQTMVKDPTGMDVANASLLHETTAAAEAMAMLHRLHGRTSRKGESATVFFVSEKVAPETLAVLRSRAAPIGIQIKVGQFLLTPARAFAPSNAPFQARNPALSTL